MESAKLYMGYYEIKVSGTEGQDAARADLTQKLISIYGDYDLETSPQNVYRLWYGAEGTMVSLKKHWSHSGNDYYVTIRYSYEDGETLLQNARSAIDHEFSLITTGLYNL